MVNKLLIFREDFAITSRSFKLECSLYSPVYLKDSKRPVVIYLHGNSSSRLESCCYANMFASEGISFINFDFGGCGISEGDYVSLGWHEKEDLINLIQYLREKRFTIVS
jgi:alpha/beta superfamily hydrolase